MATLRIVRLKQGDVSFIVRADATIEINDGTSRLLIGLEENLGKTIQELAELFAKTVERINESSNNRINRN